MIWFVILLFVAMVVALIVRVALRNWEGERHQDDPRPMLSWFSFGLGCAVVFFFVITLITVIPAGHVGVKVLFGKVRPTVLTEGLHFKNPFLAIHKMTVQTQSYTMTSVVTEGEVKDRSDAIQALTKDNLTVGMDVTVLFRLVGADAPEVYRTLGFTDVYTDKIVRPGIREAIRDSVVRYEASEIMSEKRTEAGAEIKKRLEVTFGERGLECENVMLRNIVPPEKLQAAIEDKLAAEQEAQAMEFVLQKEKLEADRKVFEARGIADSQAVINKTLTKEYLQWYYIETLKKLVDSPNNSTIILPFDQNLTPMFNVK